jgi:hypothetical protein
MRGGPSEPVYRSWLQTALSCIGKVAPRGCIRDGGRSSGVDMQVKVPNRLKLLWSKVMVVSVEEKAYEDTSGMNQEGER